MAQPMPAFTQVQVSPELAQIAASSQLGSPLAEYRVRFSVGSIIYGVILLLIGLFMALAALGSTDEPASLVICTLLALILFAGSFYFLAKPLIFNSWRVGIFTNGLVVKKWGKVDAPRWEQIQDYTQRVVRMYIYAVIPVYTSHVYTIQIFNGPKLKLNDTFPEVEKIAAWIEQKTTEVKLPQAIAAFNAGQNLVFGSLTVNQGGLTKGNNHLNWNEVGDFKVETGAFIIKKQGQFFRWFSAPVYRVPNLAVLIGLINHVYSNRNQPQPPRY